MTMRSITLSRRRAALATIAAGALLAVTGATAEASSAPPDSMPSGSEPAGGELSIGGAGGSVAPNPDIEQGLTIYFIPKDTQNPYEVIADAGGATALEELGGEQVVSSGTEDTAAAQIPSIQAAIADQADAIVIAGNDPDALCPSLQQAQDAGIVVVSFDSDVSCADHLFINQAETNNIGTAEVDYMAELLGGTGEVAILSAAATATNQNAWIEAMKTQFEKYPDMPLVDIVYGNDDPATSLTVLQGLLSAHPDLAGIISPTTVGISTAAQYLSTHPEIDVQLTGLGLPSQMAPYVHDGTVQGFMLWNPNDLGYLAGYAAASLASGIVDLEEGGTFSAGKLGTYTINAVDGGFQVILGPPTVFDESNVDDFNF
jgi:rhamnose transport system substrate-binding protein